jgi:hypothetical protein
MENYRNHYLGISSLGMEKAGEKISKGAQIKNFWKFFSKFKGSPLVYKNDV